MPFLQPPLHPGDQLEIRDFSPYVQEPSSPSSFAADTWQLRDYTLLDGTPGRMLAVNALTRDTSQFSSHGMPPVIEIPLNLDGLYSIYLGMPLLDWKPILPGAPCGVDAALDGEPFINVGPEYGVRHGRILEETNREILMFFKNARLTHRTLRIRVPFGTFNSLPLGHVRAALSCIRLVRLEDSTPLHARSQVSYPDTEDKKPLIIVCDGFSHYFSYANIGECMDLRLPACYADSDVKIMMTQIAGPTLWKSQVTSYMGEGFTEEDLVGKRAGDIRAIRYIQWSIENQQESLRQQAKACHDVGMEFHFSIRANLFFHSDSSKFGENVEKYMNGRWWQENPDARRDTGCTWKLDYAKEKTRHYFASLFQEALDKFPIDGINFDFTRWPPILDPEKDDETLLLTIAREIRSLVDAQREKTGRPIQFSMTFVDGYHAGKSLEEQKINFEALMRERLLDFVMVEAWDMKKYCDLAHRYKTPIYAVQDGESIYYPGGFRQDPLWKLPDGRQQDDPAAGEELLAQPDIRSCLTPGELNIALDRFYTAGADGAAFINRFMGDLTIRDSGCAARVKARAASGEIYGQLKGSYIFF